eukprot:552196_1
MFLDLPCFWLHIMLLTVQLQICAAITDHSSTVVWTIHNSELQQMQNTFTHMTSQEFQINKSLWNIQIDPQTSNNTTSFDIELCLSLMPLQWNRIQIFFSVSVPSSPSEAQNELWYDNSDNEICIVGDSFLMNQANTSKLKYTKITMFVNIKQIHADHQVLYKDSSALNHFDSNYYFDITKWDSFPSEQFSKIINLYLNATYIRKYKTSNVSARHRSDPKHIDDSIWNISVYQNDHKGMFTTNICLTEMPDDWFQVDAFCSIAYCQIGVRQINNVSFSKMNEEWCLAFYVDSKATELIHIMTFSLLELEVSINIAEITDNYGYTVYQNLQLWDEFQAKESFKEEIVDMICLHDSISEAIQMSTHESLYRFEFIDCDTLSESHNVYGDTSTHKLITHNEDIKIHVASNVLESLTLMHSIVSAIFSIVTIIGLIELVSVGKTWCITQLVVSKGKTNRKCGWMKCNRTKTNFHLYMCKGCRSTHYCGSSHQKKDWKYVHHRFCF